MPLIRTVASEYLVSLNKLCKLGTVARIRGCVPGDVPRQFGWVCFHYGDKRYGRRLPFRYGY